MCLHKCAAEWTIPAKRWKENIRLVEKKEKDGCSIDGVYSAGSWTNTAPRGVRRSPWAHSDFKVLISITIETIVKNRTGYHRQDNHRSLRSWPPRCILFFVFFSKTFSVEQHSLLGLSLPIICSDSFSYFFSAFRISRGRGSVVFSLQDRTMHAV